MRKLFFAFLLLATTLGTMYTTTAMAAMEITIYLTRSNTDQATATTTYDTVSSYTMRATNVQDFVSSVNNITGLSLVQSGSTGQNVSLFMRGGDSNHTLVTMNGIPIKDASTTNGLHDFGNNFMASISAIEIIKNPSGALVGPNSIGGVVNFITGDFYENNITFKAGSNNTRGVSVQLTETKNNTSYNIAVDGLTSDGISIKDGNEKDGYIARDFMVSTRTIIDGGYFKTNFIAKNNDVDLDGTSDDADYTAENLNHIYQFILKKDNKWGHTDLAIGHTTYDRTYTNGNEVDTYDSATTNYILSQTIEKDKIDFVPGIEYEHSEAKFNNTGSYTSSVDAYHYNTAYFLNSNWKATDKTMISSGIRLDTLEDYDDYYTHKLGAYYLLTDDIKLRTNWSNSVRTPTLYEKYGADSYGYSGNSALNVEKGETLDVGISVGKFDLVYYTTDITDAITYGNSTYSNVTGTSNRDGIESTFNYDINSNWNHNIGAHWSQAEDSNGTELLRRPKWTANQSLTRNKDKFTTTVSHRYTGEHVDLDSSTYARKEMNDLHLFDFHHSIAMNENTNITASIMNITDEDYERPDGYNQNGRTWFLSYNMKF